MSLSCTETKLRTPRAEYLYGLLVLNFFKRYYLHQELHHKNLIQYLENMVKIHKTGLALFTKKKTLLSFCSKSKERH